MSFFCAVNSNLPQVAVLMAAEGVWRVLKLAVPQLMGPSLSWKGVVGCLVHVYTPGCRRKK